MLTTRDPLGIDSILRFIITYGVNDEDEDDDAVDDEFMHIDIHITKRTPALSLSLQRQRTLNRFLNWTSVEDEKQPLIAGLARQTRS